MIVMVSCSQLSEMKRKTLSRVKRHTISMSMSTETPILVSVTYHIIICLKGQPLKDIPFLEVISSFDFLFVVEGFLSVPPQKRVISWETAEDPLSYAETQLNTQAPRYFQDLVQDVPISQTTCSWIGNPDLEYDARPPPVFLILPLQLPGSSYHKLIAVILKTLPEAQRTQGIDSLT